MPPPSSSRRARLLRACFTVGALGVPRICDAASMAAPTDASADAGPSASPRRWPVLDSPPGPAVGLDAIAGIQVLATSEKEYAHGLVGGRVRGRFGYAQAGAELLTTDRVADDASRAVGGFAGVFFPYHHWIDLEGVIGLSSRTFTNTAPLYGAGGYEFSTAAITWRVGITDRTSSRLVGARLGAELVGAVDLHHFAAPWQYSTGEGAAQHTVSGVTAVGGVSFGLQLSVGFDVGAAPRSSR